jgi:hypothetical protein
VLTRPPAVERGSVGVKPDPIDQVPVTGSPERATDTTARNRERSGAMSALIRIRSMSDRGYEKRTVQFAHARDSVLDGA